MDTELTIDIEAGFTPKQREATAVADTHKYTLYGGSKGPGKSHWLRWYLLRFPLLCHDAGIDGVNVGLFCESYPTLKDRQISKIEREFPASIGELKESKAHGFGFHLHPELGGGVLMLRNLDEPMKYSSAEFAAIAVDELTMNKVDVFNALRGSLRWPGIKNTRFVAATNPGNIGHLWVKAYWIDRAYPKELEPLRDEFAFVRALPDDNPYLDESYWNDLNTLPPALARAWRWGEWDVFEGQVFGQWRRDAHVCEPFVLPDHYIRWRCIDWGFAAPFCCLWLAKDPDTGRVYVYRELYQDGLTDRQQATAVKDNTPGDERITITYADPSMWTRRNMEGRIFSTADEYAAGGVPLARADNSRLIGKRRIDTLLAPLPDGKPGMIIFSTCVNLIRTLPAMPYDPRNIEDIDPRAEEHAVAALRYGLSGMSTKVTAVRIIERLRDPVTDRLVNVGGAGVFGGRDF